MNTHAEGIERVHAEAGGLLNLIVLRTVDIPAVMVDALRGDRDARRVMTTLEKAIIDITSAPRRARKFCASCPRPLRNSAYSFAIALPACDDPTQALALAVCTRCATSRDDIRDKAAAALRAIWPESRLVTLTHSAGGRA